LILAKAPAAVTPWLLNGVNKFGVVVEEKAKFPVFPRPPMGGGLLTPPAPPPRLPVVTTSSACAKLMGLHMPLEAESACRNNDRVTPVYQCAMRMQWRRSAMRSWLG
jgi:hypothetical protein